MSEYSLIVLSLRFEQNFKPDGHNNTLDFCLLWDFGHRILVNFAFLVYLFCTHILIRRVSLEYLTIVASPTISALYLLPPPPTHIDHTNHILSIT
jgi:hypothetical protein